MTLNSMEVPRITVCVPARNEEVNLPRVLEAVRTFADELLVVDGHSTDGTVQIARELGARVVRDNGRGKGDGIRTGIREASGEIIVFIDADGSHDPRDIPAMVNLIAAGEADLVIGSRGKGGSDELHGDVEKLVRMIGSDIILICINLRFQAQLTDSQNGFRAIRTSVARALGLDEEITTIEQEMTIKTLKGGYQVAEIPSHEYARKYGESAISLRKPHVWFRYVWSVVKNLY